MMEHTQNVYAVGRLYICEGCIMDDVFERFTKFVKDTYGYGVERSDTGVDLEHVFDTCEDYDESFNETGE